MKELKIPGADRPETELAAYHKRCVNEALEKVCAALDAADQDGFEISFNVGKDQTRRYRVTGLRCIRDY